MMIENVKFKLPEKPNWWGRMAIIAVFIGLLYLEWKMLHG